MIFLVNSPYLLSNVISRFTALFCQRIRCRVFVLSEHDSTYNSPYLSKDTMSGLSSEYDFTYNSAYLSKDTMSGFRVTGYNFGFNSPYLLYDKTLGFQVMKCDFGFNKSYFSQGFRITEHDFGAQSPFLSSEIRTSVFQVIKYDFGFNSPYLLLVKMTDFRSDSRFKSSYLSQEMMSGFQILAGGSLISVTSRYWLLFH